ncbi:DUF4145 domain-containing protein [Flexibacterium corallicola]|uniref:DUF4145 domain-containing protein n=1 Tax=Flexibacterium corallicola TaxID=3037259 RepID=UPI00286F7750|nr:DUF4145 domain-containing protein [Pseudovibrio sp. M1P-2-3]
MSEFVSDCSWCNAKKVTFAVNAIIPDRDRAGDFFRYAKVTGVCRNCGEVSLFRFGTRKPTLRSNSFAELHSKFSRYFNDIHEQIRPPAWGQVSCPEHLPNDLETIFTEAARCQAESCYNAAGAMCRLCLDVATKKILPNAPAGDGGPNQKARKNLADRINWLFEKGDLSKRLKRLADHIRFEGNDGVHDGTLGKSEVEDLMDFTVLVLKDLFTEPQRIALAEERREQRRKMEQKEEA